MKWKDAEKYKPKKHKANNLFSIDVVLCFGTDVLDEPDTIGYYDFYNNQWVHEGFYTCRPVAFLEYPVFTGEF